MPPTESHSARLFTPEFIGLCLVMFLAICNNAVFFNLHLHLSSLGIIGEDAGVLIGLYSLTAMALYATASPYVRPANAVRLMTFGISIIGIGGLAYLKAGSFAALSPIRIANGAGFFLLMSSAMALLVRILPPDKVGRGFSIFSVALLLPYAVVPASIDAVPVLRDNPAYGYALMSLLLLPALPALRLLGRKIRKREVELGAPAPLGLRTLAVNMGKRPVAVLMLVNGLSFINFAGLFFLFKGLATQRGLGNVGAFFSIQMAVMILLRLFGSRIFDTVNRRLLLVSAFLLNAAGYALLLRFTHASALPWIACLFGLGLGLAAPTLNTLMYEVSDPEHRGLNANLLMLSMQLGNFLGPLAGATMVARMGYPALLVGAAGLNLFTAALFPLAMPSRRPVEADGSD